MAAWLHGSNDGYAWLRKQLAVIIIRLEIIFYFLHFEQQEIDKASLFY